MQIVVIHINIIGCIILTKDLIDCNCLIDYKSFTD